MIYRSNTTKLNEQTSLDESSNLVLLEYKGHYPDTYEQQEYDITDKKYDGMIKSNDIAVDKKSVDKIIDLAIRLLKDKFEKYNLKCIFMDIYSYYWNLNAVKKKWEYSPDLEFTAFRETERFGVEADICDENQAEFKALRSKLIDAIVREYKKLPDDKKYERAAIFLIKDGDKFKTDIFIIPKHGDDYVDPYIKDVFYDTKNNQNSLSYGFGKKYILAPDKASEKDLVTKVEKLLLSKFSKRVKFISVEIFVDGSDGVYKFMAPLQVSDYQFINSNGLEVCKDEAEYVKIQEKILDLLINEYKKLPEDKRYNRARIFISREGNSIDADVMVRDPKIKFDEKTDINSRILSPMVSKRIEL